MKLYLVEPNLVGCSDRASEDARQRACIAPIADLILSHLAEDPALFAMRHKGEASSPCIPPKPVMDMQKWPGSPIGDPSTHIDGVR